MTGAKRRNTGKNLPRKRLVCTKCHKVGHNTVYPVRKITKPTKPIQNLSEMICAICLDKGHKGRTCPNLLAQHGDLRGVSTEFLWSTSSNTHVVNNKDFFSKFYKPTSPLKLTGPTSLVSRGAGNVFLQLGNGDFLKLADANYCPDAPRNIISHSQILKVGYSVNIIDGKLINDENSCIGQCEDMATVKAIPFMLGWRKG